MQHLLRGISHPDCLLYHFFNLLTRCFLLFIDLFVTNSSDCSLRTVLFWDYWKRSPPPEINDALFPLLLWENQ